MNLTKSQQEKIEAHLNAFKYNLGDVRIEREYDGLYVFHPADSEHYVQHCPNIDYLNGWLYGCVQANMGIVKGAKND